MTGLEALDLLRKGNVKVKRSEWHKDEYLETFDGEDVYPSTEYDRKRGDKCNYPKQFTLICLAYPYCDNIKPIMCVNEFNNSHCSQQKK